MVVVYEQVFLPKNDNFRRMSLSSRPAHLRRKDILSMSASGKRRERGCIKKPRLAYQPSLFFTPLILVSCKKASNSCYEKDLLSSKNANIPESITHYRSKSTQPVAMFSAVWKYSHITVLSTKPA